MPDTSIIFTEELDEDVDPNDRTTVEEERYNYWKRRVYAKRRELDALWEFYRTVEDRCHQLGLSEAMARDPRLQFLEPIK